MTDKTIILIRNCPSAFHPSADSHVLTGYGFLGAVAQESPKEEDFFKILKVTAPEGTLLEVGGLTVLPDGNLGVATRRGDVWIVENPTSRSPFLPQVCVGSARNSGPYLQRWGSLLRPAR